MVQAVKLLPVKLVLWKQWKCRNQILNPGQMEGPNRGLTQ